MNIILCFPDLTAVPEEPVDSDDADQGLTPDYHHLLKSFKLYLLSAFVFLQFILKDLIFLMLSMMI